MRPRRERRGVRAAVGLCKGLALLLWLGVFLPLQALVVALTRDGSVFWLPPLIHRGICGILGIDRQVRGTPVAGGKVLWVGNHLSYLDIPVLGCSLRAAFVAKREVRGWPLLGWMARLQRTVFVSRDRRDVLDARRRVDRVLATGGALVLFPEGTSSDGRQVLTFRSSLLPDAAPGRAGHVLLQPVALQLLSADGMPAGLQQARDAYAYYGDMRLPTHLWHFLQGSGAVLRVSFLAPTATMPGESRQRLAARLERAVRDAMAGDQSSRQAQDAR